MPWRKFQITHRVCAICGRQSTNGAAPPGVVRWRLSSHVCRMLANSRWAYAHCFRLPFRIAILRLHGGLTATTIGYGRTGCSSPQNWACPRVTRFPVSALCRRAAFQHRKGNPICRGRCHQLPGTFRYARARARDNFSVAVSVGYIQRPSKSDRDAWNPASPSPLLHQGICQAIVSVSLLPLWRLCSAGSLFKIVGALSELACLLP